MKFEHVALAFHGTLYLPLAKPSATGPLADAR
jgi:hypothetical protein